MLGRGNTGQKLGEAGRAMCGDEGEGHRGGVDNPPKDFLVCGPRGITSLELFNGDGLFAVRVTGVKGRNTLSIAFRSKLFVQAKMIYLFICIHN